MVRIMIFVMALLGGVVFTAPKSAGQDHYVVYNKVLNSFLKNYKSKSFVMVRDSTTTTELKRIDFKRIHEYLAPAKTLEGIKDSKWESFPNGIESNTIRNTKLKDSFHTNVHIIVSSPKNNTERNKPLPQRLRSPKDSKGIVYVSPVVYSKDQKKSICTIQIFKNPEESSSILYFLEKRSNKQWKIVSELWLSIS